MPLLNGRNWTSVDFEGYEYVKNFPLIFEDMLAEIQNRVVKILMGLGLFNSTSSDPITIGTGQKTATIETSKGFIADMFVVLIDSTDPSLFMVGKVISYNSLNGELVADITLTNGAGSHSTWLVGVVGSQVPDRVKVVDNTVWQINEFADVGDGSYQPIWERIA